MLAAGEIGFPRDGMNSRGGHERMPTRARFGVRASSATKFLDAIPAHLSSRDSPDEDAEFNCLCRRDEKQLARHTRAAREQRAHRDRVANEITSRSASIVPQRARVRKSPRVSSLPPSLPPSLPLSLREKEGK